MSLMDALAIEPFSVNEPLIDSLLLEPDSMEVYFVYEAGGTGSGSGTIDDPYVVGSASAFDTKMKTFSALRITFHLGAGDFLTKGYREATDWLPKEGWRFVGAGSEVTTLRLDTGGTFTADNEYFVIGGPDSPPADGFEIQDLTLDPNLPNINASIAASGIKVFGSGIRIHHIRVINFGTKTTAAAARAIVTAGAYPGNPEPFDCVIEDCEIDRPFRNSVRETHCIVLAGGEGSTDGFMAYHKGCVIRNNYIDCHYTQFDPAPTVNKETAVSSITVAGGVATVTTKVDHNLVDTPVPSWFVLHGALEHSVLSPRYNGSFQVVQRIDARKFTFNHYVPSPTPDPPLDTPADPTGDMYVGRVPSRRAAINSLSRSGTVWTLVTKTPHYRLPNDTVVLANVTVGGGLNNVFNAAFPITAIDSPYQLKFNLNSSETPDVGQAYIGVDFYGITTAGGRGVIIEGNRLHSVTFGYYHKEFSTIDVAIRDNHFLGVLAAVYGKLGQVSGGDGNQQPLRAGAALNATGTIAEFTTVDPHGLAKGDVVLVANASIAAYNGMFKIDSVTSPKKFKYTTLTAPGGPATGMKFGALWRVGRWIIENNTVDLIGTLIPAFDPPTAIRLERTASNPAAPTSPYVFGQIVVIGNVIRMIENAFDSTTAPVGIKLNNCEQAIVEDNVINLIRTTPIEFVACGVIKFFNNQSPSGKLLQGYDVTNSRLMNELETDVDLAAVSVM